MATMHFGNFTPDGAQVRIPANQPRAGIPVHLSDEAAQKIAAHLHSLMTPRGSYSSLEFQAYAYIGQILSQVCHLITPKPGDLLVINLGPSISRERAEEIYAEFRGTLDREGHQAVHLILEGDAHLKHYGQTSLKWPKMPSIRPEQADVMRERWARMYLGVDPATPAGDQSVACKVKCPEEVTPAPTPVEDSTTPAPTWRDLPSMLGPAG